MTKSTLQHDQSNADIQRITQIIHQYFDGLYYGDIDILAAVFREDTVLKAPYLTRSLEQWFSDIVERPIPADETKGSHIGFRILSIEVVGDQAMVKVECPLFDFEYIDFLGLLKENQQWLIVSKMYVDMAK